MITSLYLYVDRRNSVQYGWTRTMFSLSMYPGIPRVVADRIATAFVRERVIRLNNRIKYVD